LSITDFDCPSKTISHIFMSVFCPIVGKSLEAAALSGREAADVGLKHSLTTASRRARGIQRSSDIPAHFCVLQINCHRHQRRPAPGAVLARVEAIAPQ
jgi:hypothetical protein